MLNVEQVRLLEERVQRVISRTAELQRENGSLREQLEGYQERIRELETHIETFVSNQAEIEKGVLNALHQLDEVEDAVVEGVQEDRVIADDDESGVTDSNSPAVDQTPAETPEEDRGRPEDEARESSSPDDLPADNDSSDDNYPPGHDTIGSGEDASNDDNERSGPELDIF